MNNKSRWILCYAYYALKCLKKKQKEMSLVWVKGGKEIDIIVV